MSKLRPFSRRQVCPACDSEDLVKEVKNPPHYGGSTFYPHLCDQCPDGKVDWLVWRTKKLPPHLHWRCFCGCTWRTETASPSEPKEPR